VRLFVDRAQAVRPDFQVRSSNAAAVAALCRRLEGLPLALELAAARVGVLTPAQMLARLDKRFELLVRRRAADARHRSLWAALDWSYQLLPPELQRFFARLSVFRGGWTLEAAEGVCEAPKALDYLTELQANSLVLTEEQGGELRYWLLETLREYGHERLVESGELEVGRTQHLRYFLAFAERVCGAVERMEPEHGNLRAALDWAVEQGNAGAALQAMFRMGWFWNTRGYLAEGRRRVTEILALPGALRCRRERALALIRAGELAQSQGDYAAARRLIEEGLGIWREVVADPTLPDESLGSWQELRARYLCEQWGIGEALRILGHITLSQGEYRAARAFLEEALALFRELERQCEISDTVMVLAGAARGEGDYRRAAELYEESIARYQKVGQREWLIAIQRRDLGHVAYWQGDYGRAEALFRESLAVLWDQGHKLSIPACFIGLAGVAGVRGQPARAARLLGAAEALLETIGAALTAVERAEHERYMAAVRGQLNEAEFAAGRAAGREMPLEEAVLLGLDRAND
jgi:non-specific serine/threonine protein kinase